MNNRTKLVTLAILFLILILLAVYQFVIKKPNRVAKAKPKDDPDVVEAAVEKPPLPSLEETEILDTWLTPDPLEDPSHEVAGRFGVPPAEGPEVEQPGVEVVTPGEEPMTVVPTVTGIIAVEGEYKAIIGGRTYACDEEIPGSAFRITEITHKTVTFEDNKGRVAKATLLQ